MKKLKTAIIVLAVLLLISLAYFFIPADRILSSLPFVKDLYNNTSITVNSRNGKAEVIINGKNHGETPVDLSGLEEGQYEITLKRVSENIEFYKTRNYKIDLPRNTEAVIDLEIGPADSTSGYILYYTKSPATDDSGYITIQNTPEDASVFLDGEFLAKTPVNAYTLKEKDYQVKVTAAGYEDVSFPIVVREGYNLNIRSYQFPVPINIEE
jgi:hypothetical protein